MTIQALNHLPEEQLREQLFNCCGSTKWVDLMLKQLPFASHQDILDAAVTQWNHCVEPDWREAFTHHPKIGDVASLTKKFAATAAWASGEQQSVQQATATVIQQLAEGNAAYEEKFGFIFIVCATGKSAEEMLQLLQLRLPNDVETELHIAQAEQMKITLIRLNKLLA